MIKIALLIDSKNNWIDNYFTKRTFKSSSKFNFNIFKNQKKIKKYDIVFVIGYTKILKKNFLKNNKLTLIIHESNLPKGKGFSPVQWQLIKGKTKLTICLVEASHGVRVDSGRIYLKSNFKIPETSLLPEIRKYQFLATINIIKKFLKIYPNIYPKKQRGQSTYFKKRTLLDNEININKSIKKNFNLMRIADNDRYPSYFWFKNKKFIIKIFDN